MEKKIEDERISFLERKKDALREKVESLRFQLLKKDFCLENLRKMVKKDKCLEDMEIKWRIVNTIAENSKRLVNELASNSPYQCPFLAYLITGLVEKTAMDYFQISKRTLERILGEKENNLLKS